MKNAITNVLGTIIGLYFISVILFFTPYYNWKYAHENGFVKWVFFGEIVATLKASVWPYFEYYDKSQKKSVALARSTAELATTEKHLEISMVKSKEAYLILQGVKPTEENVQQLFDKVTVLVTESLVEAELIDFPVLRKAYPDMGEAVETLYLPSLRLLYDGLKNKDQLKIAQSDKLSQQFVQYIKTLDVQK